jgi:hypothetical protein
MVSVMDALYRLERSASIDALEHLERGRPDDVRVRRVHGEMGEVPGTDEQVALSVDLLPVLGAVVGAEETTLLRFDESIDPPRIRGRDVDRYLPGNSLGESHALDLFPRVTTVSGDEETAGVPAGDQAPGTPPRFPHAREDDARIRRIDRNARRPRVLVDEQDFLPALSSVRRAIDASFRIGAEGVA